MHRKFFSGLPLFLFSPEGDAAGTAPVVPATAPVTGTPDPNDTPEGDEPEPEPISANATIQELRSDLERANRRITEVIGEKRKLQGKAKTTTADAAQLEAYRKYGTPEEIKARLERGDAAITSETTRAKTSSLVKAAEVPGINAEALASLPGALDVEYIVEGEGDNAKAFVSFKGSDGKDAKKPLDEWVKATYPAFETVLFATATVPVVGGKKLVPFVKSAPAGSGRSSNVWDKIRAEKKAKKEEANPQKKSWMDQAGVNR